MHHVKTFPKSIIAICLLALLITACSHTSSNVTSPLPNAEFSAADLQKTVARVNGKEITAAELKRAETILIANKPGFQVPPLRRKEFETQTLDQLISMELLFQASQKLEIKDLDKNAEIKLAQVKKGFPDGKVFARGLQEIGMDEKTFLDSIRRDLAIAYFVDTTFAANVTVSEEEIKTFYEKNPKNFLQEEQVRVSHILIGVDGKAGVEEKKADRDKAEKLRADLVNGADFATLARENSTCPSSKQGGDLGFFSKGKMVPQFGEAAFALEPGGLSQVVETPFGYHVIKLVERKKAETISLSASRDKIKGYLKALKIFTANEAFVGAARKSSKIDLLL
jgi:peptidyl-prolyl cis-trans isomerase C